MIWTLNVKGFSHSKQNLDLRSWRKYRAPLDKSLTSRTTPEHQNKHIHPQKRTNIMTEISSSVAKQPQQPAQGDNWRWETDMALHFTALKMGPLVRFWSSAPLSESIWQTRSSRYRKPHTLSLTDRGWEEMVVSLRRWWCLNCASDSPPCCTSRELLHRYSSRILRPRPDAVL